VGWHSSVGVATRYGLDGPGIEFRRGGWGGARCCTPVQPSPGTHPASYTMGAGSLPGVKRPGRGVEHPPTSSAEVKERVKDSQCVYGFSVSVSFPSVYKQMLRWFPTFQVATTCFSCSPPDLNFLDPYFIFTYMHNCHCHPATGHLQLNISLLLK